MTTTEPAPTNRRSRTRGIARRLQIHALLSARGRPASAYESRMDMLTEAKHEMTRLSRLLGETVQICYRDDDLMVVAAMSDGEGHFRVSSDVGTRVPLNWTASGRLLVVHLPDRDRVEMFRAIARPSPTGLAETDPE